MRVIQLVTKNFYWRHNSKSEVLTENTHKENVLLHSCRYWLLLIGHFFPASGPGDLASFRNRQSSDGRSCIRRAWGFLGGVPAGFWSSSEQLEMSDADAVISRSLSGKVRSMGRGQSFALGWFVFRCSLLWLSWLFDGLSTWPVFP